MGNFEFRTTGIDGLYLIEPKVYGDQRGYFMETYNEAEFKAAGLDIKFVQDNQSFSRKGVLRGLHYQKQHPQGKLVRALYGAIYDVAIDLRKNSKTYGQWYGVVLSGENNKMLYVPEGFAHGFYVISDEVCFIYKCTDFYHPEDEGGIIWNDKDLAIQWPISEGMEVILSEKDKKLPTLRESGWTFDI
ncbi:MAG: dTDP-4-dehydrorhamnose 3,5-epimerase [Clostridiales bacterium]|nr:dTDP-4-dehydrorhamnose 3,5-epimerase [Clostridiales bacterium]